MAKNNKTADCIQAVPVRSWTTDSDGVIHFSVTGLGLTGSEMEKHLVSNGHKNYVYAEQLLNSFDYVPCEKGKIYNLSVLPGKLFSDEKRTIENIRAEGHRRGLTYSKDLPTEIGCLIRLNFSNQEIEQMGLYWLVTMYEPAKDSDGDPFLFGTDRVDGMSWLRVGWVRPDDLWRREAGFVFGASQVSPQD